MRAIATQPREKTKADPRCDRPRGGKNVEAKDIEGNGYEPCNERREEAHDENLVADRLSALNRRFQALFEQGLIVAKHEDHCDDASCDDESDQDPCTRPAERPGCGEQRNREDNHLNDYPRHQSEDKFHRIGN